VPTANRRLGRLPGQIPVGLRDLSYYVAGSLPAPPPSVAVPEVANWAMLGNAIYGDCGVAGLQHGLEAAATDTGETSEFPFPNDREAIAYYLEYTGGQDTGVVLSQYLAYVRQNGYYRHTVQAYAPVAVHDVPLLQSAVDLFDFAYCGITVTAAMEQASADGETWTAPMTEGQVLGGHCVPIVGYSESSLTIVTWGSLQEITYNAWHRMSDEAWAVISGELVSAGDDGHGVNLAALQSDLDSLDA
jgi:hypothetical protein